MTSISMRRLGSQAVLRLGAEATGRVATFALVLWAARLLTPADYGRYNFALAWGFLLAQLADLGLQILTTRAVADQSAGARGYVQGALALKARLAPAVLVLAGMTIFAWPATWSPSVRLVMLAVAITPLLHTFVEFAAYIFRGEQRIEREAALLAGLRLLAALLGGLGLALAGSLAGLALGQLTAAVLGFIIAIGLIRRAGWLETAPRPAGRAQLGEALPLGVAIFLSIAYSRLALLLLQAWADETAVAQFSAALRLVEPAQIIPASLLAAVFPAYVRRRRSDPRGARRLAGRTTGLLAGIALLGILAAQLSAGRLIPLLYPDPVFRPTIPIFRWLAWSIAPAFVNYSLTHYLIARGQQRAIAWLTGGMLVLHAALIRLLLPGWGAAGPALSIVAAELLLLAGCLIALSQPAADDPGTDGPAADGPGTDGPGTDGPGTDGPGTDGPGTDGPEVAA